MSSYSLVFATVGAMAFAMAAAHLALWIAIRRETAQLWVGLCCVCLGLVGAGQAAAGRIVGNPDPGIWLLALVPATALHPLMALAIWSLFERPVTGARRVILRVLVGVAAAVAMERVAAVAGLHRVATSSDDLLWGGPAAPVAVALLLGPLVIFVVESIGAWRRHRAIALAASAAALGTALGLFGSIAMGRLEYVPLSGLPFYLFASATVLAGYVRNARRAELAGEYRLEKRIAGGGMGELFLAHKTGPGGFSREVALKRIRPEMLGDAAAAREFEARFLSEARLAASLSHPNLIAVHDLGKLDEGGWFLAMELLHGSSLAHVRKALFERRALAPPEVLAAIGEQLCRGLAAAHAAGIVHRDVSPHNVMLTRDGVVKIVDFGIAKSVAHPEEFAASGVPSPGSASGSGGDELTLPGKVLGKLGYLAPEQLAGEPAAPASDLYASGVVLYELACGQRPWRKPGDLDSLPRRSEWRSARTYRPELPEDLDAALTAALAWESDARPGASALAERFRRVGGVLPYADLGGWLRGFGEEKPAAPVVEAPTVELKTDATETRTRPSSRIDG